MYKCVFLGISCGFPGYIANGYINGRQYNYLDIIQYVCNPGYRLFGESTRTCQVDNKWSGDTPTCEGKTKIKTSSLILQFIILLRIFQS